MKRMILIVMMFSMMLLGCSGPDGSQPAGSNQKPGETEDQAGNGNQDLFQEEPAVLELGEGKREESMIVLQITINPEFEIYLDMEAVISKIRCMNEDAQTLFRELDVLGKPYYEGIEEILEAAHGQGFISADTAEIKMEVTVQVDGEEQQAQGIADSLAEPVTAFKEEKGLALDVTVPAPKVIVSKSDSSEGQEGKTENGASKIEEIEIVDADTGKHMGTHTKYIDANGFCYKEEYVYDDGRNYNYTEFYPNGNKKKWYWESPDGTIKDENYNEEGKLTDAIYRYSDGLVSEVTYHADGETVATQLDTYPDGMDWKSVYISYAENGKRISENTVFSDGTVLEASFYENGNRKVQISDGPDGHLETHFFEDGTWSKSVHKNSDGSYDETTYYASGMVSATISNNGDYYKEMRYAEDGSIIYDKLVSPGEEYIYDNGQIVKLILDGVEITDPAIIDSYKKAYE